MHPLNQQPARTITKQMQTRSKRIKPKQKTLGAISPSVRQEVRERSGEICEVRVKCHGQKATQQAHKRGRRIIDRRTTAEDLWDACDHCHAWLDSTGSGAIYKRETRSISEKR